MNALRHECFINTHLLKCDLRMPLQTEFSPNDSNCPFVWSISSDFLRLQEIQNSLRTNQTQDFDSFLLWSNGLSILLSFLYSFPLFYRHLRIFVGLAGCIFHINIIYKINWLMKMFRQVATDAKFLIVLKLSID